MGGYFFHFVLALRIERNQVNTRSTPNIKLLISSDMLRNNNILFSLDKYQLQKTEEWRGKLKNILAKVGVGRSNRLARSIFPIQVKFRLYAVTKVVFSLNTALKLHAVSTV